MPVKQQSYGFDDAYENACFQHFTPVRQVDNKWSTWENSRSIFHPDNCINTYQGLRPTRIPEVKTHGMYFGVPNNPSDAGGLNHKDVYLNHQVGLASNGSARF